MVQNRPLIDRSNEFENELYFQIQKWMLQAGRPEKVDEEMGSFV